MDIWYEMIINWTKLNVSQLQHNDFNQVTVHRLQRLHWKKGAWSGSYEASRMYVHLTSVICINMLTYDVHRFNNGI